MAEPYEGVLLIKAAYVLTTLKGKTFDVRGAPKGWTFEKR
jgi:hypothetical protein